MLPFGVRTIPEDENAGPDVFEIVNDVGLYCTRFEDPGEKNTTLPVGSN
jgi:hypothetical protein